MTRKQIKAKVDRLARTRFRESIAPRSDIARAMESDLLKAGIPLEDHVLAVMNMFPKGRPVSEVETLRAENQKLKERIEYLEGQIKVNREIAMDNCAWGKDSCG